MQRSSPVTAAGPSPIYTGFPIKFLRTPECCHAYTQQACPVKVNVTTLLICVHSYGRLLILQIEQMRYWRLPVSDLRDRDGR